MSSGTSTERQAPADAGFQPWQFFLLLSMAGATAAVLLSRDTHPAALLLVSGAVFAAGTVAYAIHYALTGFLGGRQSGTAAPLGRRTREAMEHDKALALRSIKELEFDHKMRKISDADFAEISTRLRAKAVALLEELDRDAAGAHERSDAPTVAGPAPVLDVVRTCPGCGAGLDDDARFCKHCGAKVA